MELHKNIEPFTGALCPGKPEVYPDNPFRFCPHTDHERHAKSPTVPEPKAKRFEVTSD